MPRAGVTAERIIDEAVQVADRHGLDAATPRAVAERLGVRTPSLYKHLRGVTDIRRGLALRGTEELGEAMTRAMLGRAGPSAVRSLSVAYREFARRHPGLYEASLKAPAPDDRAHQEAARRVLAVVASALEEYALPRSEFIHTVRGLRATLHGFVSLEIAGGFGLPTDVDESFRRLVEGLLRGLSDPLTPRSGHRRPRQRREDPGSD